MLLGNQGQLINEKYLKINIEVKYVGYTYFPRVPCYHCGYGFRQLLPCKLIATAGGFPGIPVRNDRKERRASLAKQSATELANIYIAK